jgi:hypothetical protein
VACCTVVRWGGCGHRGRWVRWCADSVSSPNVHQEWRGAGNQGAAQPTRSKRFATNQRFLSSISSMLFSIQYSGANPDAIQFLGPATTVPFLEVANASS